VYAFFFFNRSVRFQKFNFDSRFVSLVLFLCIVWHVEVDLFFIIYNIFDGVHTYYGLWHLIDEKNTNLIRHPWMFVN
jgi:hypothetical protein